jgi:alkanesulfonate monooxygenase SsuD/methylene tetrahydromethanopterin reductase-like flavin-dependent oxidoreductase (luciferase family)
MKFAVFYEIPVARPWNERSEYWAYQHTLEQAILADKVGFDGFWTVEHHFLEEFSHCSNPEVLYGAVAARTKNLRLGYGVRLMPGPYNHPVRSAESAAVLDLLSDGRVEFGTGRSATRAELEGFGIEPADTREMWQEAIRHVVGCWTNDEYAFEGKYWSMPKRRVLPKPLQKPHPPLWGATGSLETHRLVGQMGLGLCSFAVGTPPDDIKKRLDIYREGVAECTAPYGKFINNQACVFSMVNCAPTKQESYDASRESFEWYAKYGAELIATLPKWLEERKQGLQTYDWLGELKQIVDQGLHKELTFEYLRDTHGCIAGDPDEVIEHVKQYEATGADLLLCLVNPYKIPHAQVMQTIELMGKYVIPEFRSPGDARTTA